METSLQCRVSLLMELAGSRLLLPATYATIKNHLLKLSTLSCFFLYWSYATHLNCILPTKLLLMFCISKTFSYKEDLLTDYPANVMASAIGQCSLLCHILCLK